uniref:Uncharacterized protein n=1 Tax=Glossina austeni TaxID=7395 RepID=A0A1A9UU07_GLOAU
MISLSEVQSITKQFIDSKDETMVSRRKILSRSRDDLNLDQTFSPQEEEEDVWYQKEKLYKNSSDDTEAKEEEESVDDTIREDVLSIHFASLPLKCHYGADVMIKVNKPEDQKNTNSAAAIRTSLHRCSGALVIRCICSTNKQVPHVENSEDNTANLSISTLGKEDELLMSHYKQFLNMNSAEQKLKYEKQIEVSFEFWFFLHPFIPWSLFHKN